MKAAKTNLFFIMLVAGKLGTPEPVKVSEHTRYKTNKYNRKFYLKQLFGPCTEQKVNIEIRKMR